MIGLATALCGGYSTSIDGASRLASYRRGDERAEGAVTGRSRSNEISLRSWLSRFLLGTGGGSSGWPNTKPLAAAAMAVPVPISYRINTRLEKDSRLRKVTILLMLLRLSRPNMSTSPNFPPFQHWVVRWLPVPSWLGSGVASAVWKGQQTYTGNRLHGYWRLSDRCERCARVEQTSRQS